MPDLLKRDFYFSANPCSFLLNLHFYLLPPLRIYVSNRSMFVSHLSNVGTVFFICPYCIQAGRGPNPSWDYCDTQLYLENPLSQRLAPGLTWGWRWAPPSPQPGSHRLAGSEVWIEQCLVPCRGEAHPVYGGSRGHTGYTLAEGLSPSPSPQPMVPGGAAAFAAHPGQRQPAPACAPGPQPHLPPWLPRNKI